jgi:quercetin dioxygenase-like cupin family protein
MKRFRPNDYPMQDILSSPNFFGPYQLSTLGDDTGAQNAAIVRFPPGVHNKRHSHSGGQLLVGIEGRGFVQTDSEYLDINVGDVILCPSGEVHRHGAQANSVFAHLTIAGGEGTWYDE